MDWYSQLTVVGAVAYGMVLGGAVGFDRERRNRPAGFRTHMLVAGASALLVGMGRLMVAEQLDGGPVLRIDPLRLVEAVVAGATPLAEDRARTDEGDTGHHRFHQAQRIDAQHRPAIQLFGHHQAPHSN